MKKTVKELRPGDVLMYGKDGAPNRVVLDTARLGQQINVMAAELGGCAQVKLDGLNADTLVDVEPRLNPDHVDNLIMAAREWIEGRPPTEAHRKMVRGIIDIMVPPDPPTAEELAKALLEQYEGNSPGTDGNAYMRANANSEKILDRARRAGMLK